MSNFGFLLDEGERIETVLAHLQAGVPTGWRPSRVIFRNFWFFQTEEFIWHHGRLFLGGQNAAGKSTVLSMVVPILLDGNKAEERLNTFGGHGRHMAYYITGSPTPDDTAEAAYYYPVRTSYMALEFCRTAPGGSAEYMTVGQGLHHDRSADDKTVRSWGFVVTDGRRIGRRAGDQSFDLVKENHASLSKAELKKLLGAGGEVYDTNLDYKKAVNRHLFGFKDLRDFDALIDLLLQIRRPKLTKEVKPRDVAGILTESLPVLDDAVMQVTAHSLDDIDQAVQNIERLELHTRAVADVEKAAQTVFRRMAEVAAAQFLGEALAADTACAALQEKESELANARAQWATAHQGLGESARQIALLEAEAMTLQQEDAFQAADRLAAIKQKIADGEGKLKEIHARMRQHEQRVKQLQGERDGTIDAWQGERSEALESVAEAEKLAEPARWETAGVWAGSVRKTCGGLSPSAAHPHLLAAIPRAAVTTAVRERLAEIAAVDRSAAARDTAKAAWQAASQAESQTRQRFLEAESAVSQATRTVDEGRADLAEAVQAWQRSAQALRLPESLAESVALAVRQYVHGAERHPRQALELVRPAMDQALRESVAAAETTKLAWRNLESQVTQLRQQRSELEQTPPEPLRTPEQRAARAALAEAKIPFASFYETIDFPAGGDPGAGATLEQALAAMGLLDALVVPDGERAPALAALRARGLSDRFLVPEGVAAADGASLTDALCPDPAHPLARSAAPLLSRIGVSGELTHPVRIEADGSWQHGLLRGQAVGAAAARFIGRSARERYRQAEMARLDAEIADAGREQSRLDSVLKEQGEQITRIQTEWSELHQMPGFDALQTACIELERSRSEAARAKAALEKAEEQTKGVRGAWDGAEVALAACVRTFPSAAGLNRDGLRELAASTSAVGAAFERIYNTARSLTFLQETLGRIAEQIAAAARQLEDAEDGAHAEDIALGELAGQVRGLQRLLDSPDAQSVFHQMQAITTNLAAARESEKQHIRAEAVASNQVKNLDQLLPGLRAAREATETKAAGARARLLEAVGAYPTLQSHAETAGDEAGARKVARALLSRFTERPDLAAEIQRLEMEDRGKLSAVIEEKRQTLRAFYPEHDPAERGDRLILFTVDGMRMTPHALLQHLQGEAAVLRTVLLRHEADLFERHLLQDVGREVRRCLLKGQDWVDDINRKLADYPLRNNERVELVWEPKRTDHELGGAIARHIHLIRREESLLTPEQRDTLKSAFQEEIRQIREQAKRGEWRADLFREQLSAVLDYRGWFRFRIVVKGGVGGRTEITDTVYNARSGSERALVLLLPLIAGLSVRYEAAPGAPRLLALDEGFAGIDAGNSRQLVRFLTALGLTWVVTSEKPPALTEDLRGASIYSMLRDGTVVATRPFFWDGQRLVDAEEAFWAEQADAG